MLYEHWLQNEGTKYNCYFETPLLRDTCSLDKHFINSNLILDTLLRISLNNLLPSIYNGMFRNSKKEMVQHSAFVLVWPELERMIH